MQIIEYWDVIVKMEEEDDNSVKMALDALAERHISDQLGDILKYTHDPQELELIYNHYSAFLSKTEEGKIVATNKNRANSGNVLNGITHPEVKKLYLRIKQRYETVSKIEHFNIHGYDVTRNDNWCEEFVSDLINELVSELIILSHLIEGGFEQPAIHVKCKRIQSFTQN